MEKKIEITSDLLDGLKAAGYTVRDEKAEAEFQTNLINEHSGKRTAEILSGIDKDIKDSFGIEKDTNEKTHEYLKRVANIKTQNELEIKKQYNDLDSKIKSGQIDSAWKQKHDELNEQFRAQQEISNKIKADYEAKIESIKNSFHEKEMERDLKIAINDILAPVSDDVDRHSWELALVNFFNKNVHIKRELDIETGEAKIVFYKDKNGNKWLNDRIAPMTLFEVLERATIAGHTISELVTKKYSSNTTPRTGTGSGRPNGNGNAKGAISVVPEMTTAKVTEMLINQGIMPNDSEFSKKISEYKKAYREAYSKDMV